MLLKKVIEKAKKELRELIELPVAKVIECTRTKGGWQVLLEVVERRAIPDTQDLIGVYEVLLDEDCHMTHYERVRVRRRMDLEERAQAV